jgi:hypothetical protein
MNSTDSQTRDQQIDNVLREIIRQYPDQQFNNIAQLLLLPENPARRLFDGMSHADLVTRLGRIAFQG